MVYKYTYRRNDKSCANFKMAEIRGERSLQNTIWGDNTKNITGIIGLDLCRAYNPIKVINCKAYKQCIHMLHVYVNVNVNQY